MIAALAEAGKNIKSAAGKVYKKIRRKSGSYHGGIYLDSKNASKLERAIQGRGAFRRFKDTVYYMGIEQQWYDFQTEYYRKRTRMVPG